MVAYRQDYYSVACKVKVQVGMVTYRRDNDHGGVACKVKVQSGCARSSCGSD